MKPFIVLLSVFAASALAARILRGHFEFALSARIAMSAMLIFTATGHFAFTRGMARMLPGVVPFRTGIIYLTGIFEIVAAAGLLIPAARLPAGWLLLAFFAIILPANVYAAVKHIDYQNGTFEGHGPAYLWFRIPLQIFFMAWVYVSAIRPPQPTGRTKSDGIEAHYRSMNEPLKQA